MNNKQIRQTNTFFDQTNAFFESHEKLFFGLILTITAIVSIALFDHRVSLSGDDSIYIVQAKKFISQFNFPSYQGPLYPIVLSLVVAFLGINLTALKSLSLLAMLGFMWFTFATLHRRVPAIILFTTLLLVSVNSFVLYYASQTYSEAFYMFVQSVFLYVMCWLVFPVDGKKALEHDFSKYTWLALVLLVLAITRSVGFAGIVAVCCYFLWQGEWKNLLCAILGFVIVFALYSLLKMVVWGDGQLQFAIQGSQLLQKSFYQPEYGNEDFTGLLVRFWGNSVQYLSNALFRIMGFGFSPQKGGTTLLTIVVYTISLGALYFTCKKNKPVFFITVFTGTFLVVTFISLQVAWNQDRLIIPVYPYILLCLFAFLYYLLSIKSLRKLQILYVLPLLVLLIFGIGGVLKAAKQASKITDKYSDLQPGWFNFIKAGEWCERHLAKDDLVASRKPGISSVYANGKEFYGIHKVPTWDARDLFNVWSRNPGGYRAVAITKRLQNDYFANSFYDNYYARVERENIAFWVFRNDENFAAKISSLALSTIPYESFKSIATGPLMVVYADSLLLRLRDAGVTHILSGKIGMNNVERYVFYIKERYPSFVQAIHQEGKSDNYPAVVYKIDYGVLGGR